MTLAVVEARRLIITGVVQGVGFRYHMVEVARRLGVTGWVCNRRDGSVEAHVVGAAEPIAAMIDWSKRGPPAASVKQVFVEQIDVIENCAGFQQHEAQ